MATIECVIALGMFDGLHLGHREILSQAKNICTEHGLKLIATTFSDEIGKKSFKNGGFLFDEENRVAALKDFGADEVLVFPAGEAFLDLSAVEFFDWLTALYPLCTVVMGEDFTYGKGKCGNVKTAENYFESSKVKLFVVPLKRDGQNKISTSLIKNMLAKGEIGSSNRLLGYPYYMKGVIMTGRGEGAKNNVPTANFVVSPNLSIPAAGVYRTKTLIDGKKYVSLTNLGTHPTFNDMRFNVETFVLNFSGSLYGKKIKVEFYNKIREVIHFSSKEELYRQIRKDVEEVQNDEIRGRG